MSDIQTQLPVKVTDGTNTVAVTGASAFKVDGSGVTQPVTGTITVTPSGTQSVTGTVTTVQSGTQTVTGTVTTVPTGTQTVTGTISTADDKVLGTTFTGTPQGQLILAVRNDTAAASINPTNNSYGAIAVDANGRIFVNGSITSTPSGTQVVSGTVTGVPSGTQTVTGTVTGVPSGTQTVSVTGTVTNAYDKVLNATFSGTPTGALVMAVRNDSATATLNATNNSYGAIAVDANGRIFVNGSITTTPGGEIATGIVASYGSITSVATGSTGTFSYTVTAGKTLYLKQIMAASSGAPCKVVVDYGAGPTIICVGFYASTNPTLVIPFQQPIGISASTVVNVKITNNAGSAQDVYAAIQGHEI